MSREDKQTSQRTGATTLATVVRVIGQVLDKRGLDGDAIITRAGIDPSVLDRPGERVSRAAMTRLWPLAVDATGDPAFGLLIAEHFNPAATHTLGLASISP